jgi:hypothetical protein
MRRVQAATTLVIAIAALTTITATASAAEKTLILAERGTGAKALTFKATSPEGKLEQTNGKIITCKKDTGLGSFTTPNLGTGSVLFEGCRGSLETVCTGVGDATGTIEQKGEVHFVLGLEMLTGTTATLRPVFAFLVNQFHFSCTNTEFGVQLLVLVRGCVAGVQDGGEGLLSAVTVLFEKFTKGENKVLSILMENNTKAETKCLLDPPSAKKKPVKNSN